MKPGIAGFGAGAIRRGVRRAVWLVPKLEKGFPFGGQEYLNDAHRA